MTAKAPAPATAFEVTAFSIGRTSLGRAAAAANDPEFGAAFFGRGVSDSDLRAALDAYNAGREVARLTADPEDAEALTPWLRQKYPRFAF